ncbi:hypothetical protein AVEN_268056-1, partial [Araneus ventricosus]
PIEEQILHMSTDRLFFSSVSVRLCADLRSIALDRDGTVLIIELHEPPTWVVFKASLPRAPFVSRKDLYR